MQARTVICTYTHVFILSVDLLLPYITKRERFREAAIRPSRVSVKCMAKVFQKGGWSKETRPARSRFDLARVMSLREYGG